MNKHIVIVGLGLIGGSLLKAIKPLKPLSLKGIDHNNHVVTTCHDKGLIDNKDNHIPNILENADLVMICLYPDAAVDFLREHQDNLKPGCLLTDVSGLKVNFMKSVKSFIREDVHFIGGHPMAGKEGKGFEVSTPEIFKNANYLLMYDESIPESSFTVLEELIYNLGFKHIEYLEPGEHDEIIAYTSHMPHILASTLVNCNRYNKTKACAAGSYNDLTRIAEINEKLWTELFIENREPLLNEIRSFKEMLNKLEEGIEMNSRETIEDFLIEARSKKILLKA